MKKHYKGRMLLALAAGTFAFQISAAQASGAESMVVGSLTSQPIGHYEYCKKNKRDCSIISSNTASVPLTRERWKAMVEINAFSNASVKPITDMELYGKEEVWTEPGAYGDCEDYVLMKRRMLMERGFPASSLLVTVVRQPNGEGHAVLTVRTDRADYILDNLNERILPWSETAYTYLKRQSAMHSGKWEDIVDNRRMVGSVSR